MTIKTRVSFYFFKISPPPIHPHTDLHRFDKGEYFGWSTTWSTQNRQQFLHNIILNSMKCCSALSVCGGVFTFSTSHPLNIVPGCLSSHHMPLPPQEIKVILDLPDKGSLSSPWPWRIYCCSEMQHWNASTCLPLWKTPQPSSPSLFTQDLLSIRVVSQCLAVVQLCLVLNLFRGQKVVQNVYCDTDRPNYLLPPPPPPFFFLIHTQLDFSHVLNWCEYTAS